MVNKKWKQCPLSFIYPVRLSVITSRNHPIFWNRANAKKEEGAMKQRILGAWPAFHAVCSRCSPWLGPCKLGCVCVIYFIWLLFHHGSPLRPGSHFQWCQIQHEDPSPITIQPSGTMESRRRELFRLFKNWRQIYLIQWRSHKKILTFAVGRGWFRGKVCVCERSCMHAFVRCVCYLCL